MSPDPIFIWFLDVAFWNCSKIPPNLIQANLRNLTENSQFFSEHDIACTFRVPRIVSLTQHTKKLKRLFNLTKCLTMFCYLTDLCWLLNWILFLSQLAPEQAFYRTPEFYPNENLGQRFHSKLAYFHLERAQTSTHLLSDLSGYGLGVSG